MQNQRKCTDPYCPCQDGDSCHYEDLPGSAGWPLPPGVERIPNLPDDEPGVYEEDTHGLQADQAGRTERRAMEHTFIIDTPQGIEAYRILATLRGLEMEINMSSKYGTPPTALPTRGRALRSAQAIQRQYDLPGSWRTRKQALAGMKQFCGEFNLIPKES